MARRKVLRYTPQDVASTSKSPSAMGHGSAREYYNRRYKEVDKKRRSTGLYEDSTESHRDRMEGLRKDYVIHSDPHLSRVPLLIGDAFQILRRGEHRPVPHAKKSPAGRIMNFFHWMCNKYTVPKVSSVITYWRQLSQVYVKYKGRRISPLVLKEVYEVRCYANQGMETN